MSGCADRQQHLTGGLQQGKLRHRSFRIDTSRFESTDECVKKLWRRLSKAVSLSSMTPSTPFFFTLLFVPSKTKQVNDCFWWELQVVPGSLKEEQLERLVSKLFASTKSKDSELLPPCFSPALLLLPWNFFPAHITHEVSLCFSPALFALIPCLLSSLLALACFPP